MPKLYPENIKITPVFWLMRACDCLCAFILPEYADHSRRWPVFGYTSTIRFVFFVSYWPRFWCKSGVLSGECGFRTLNAREPFASRHQCRLSNGFYGSRYVVDSAVE